MGSIGKCRTMSQIDYLGSNLNSNRIISRIISRILKCISDARKVDRQKQTVTLRLSAQALTKAKSLGKGYTSILSRILESALDDPEIIKHNL